MTRVCTRPLKPHPHITNLIPSLPLAPICPATPGISINGAGTLDTTANAPINSPSYAPVSAPTPTNAPVSAPTPTTSPTLATIQVDAYCRVINYQYTLLRSILTEHPLYRACDIL